MVTTFPLLCYFFTAAEHINESISTLLGDSGLARQKTELLRIPITLLSSFIFIYLNSVIKNMYLYGCGLSVAAMIDVNSHLDSASCQIFLSEHLQEIFLPYPIHIVLK